MQQPPRNADMGARSSRLHLELARPAVGRGSNGSRQQRTHQTYQAVRRRSTPLYTRTCCSKLGRLASRCQTSPPSVYTLGVETSATTHVTCLGA